ncbi:transposase, partial [Sphingomonas sp. RB3P16]
PGVERRRHWSDDRKLALVEAAIVPGASVAAIARDADVTPSSIYRWRRELCSEFVQPTGFATVAVHVDPPGVDHDTSDMLVIEIRGATVRAAGGVPASLLVAALRELKA